MNRKKVMVVTLSIILFLLVIPNTAAIELGGLKDFFEGHWERIAGALMEYITITIAKILLIITMVIRVIIQLNPCVYAPPDSGNLCTIRSVGWITEVCTVGDPSCEGDIKVKTIDLKIPLDNTIRAINTKLMVIISAFYSLMVVFYGVYLIFLSSSPRGRVAAKESIIRLIVGMVMVSLSPIIFQFILNFSNYLTYQIFYQAAIDLGKIKGTLGNIANMSLVLFVFWYFSLVVSFLALLIAGVRYVATMIMAAIFPLTLFFYFTNLTRGLGNSLLKTTLLVIFSQLVQAVMFALALGSVSGEGKWIDLVIAVGGLLGVLATPLIMMKLMHWIGGVIHPYSSMGGPRGTRMLAFLMRGSGLGQAITQASGQTMMGYTLGEYARGSRDAPGKATLFEGYDAQDIMGSRPSYPVLETGPRLKGWGSTYIHRREYDHLTGAPIVGHRYVHGKYEGEGITRFREEGKVGTNIFSTVASYEAQRREMEKMLDQSKKPTLRRPRSIFDYTPEHELEGDSKGVSKTFLYGPKIFKMGSAAQVSASLSGSPPSLHVITTEETIRAAMGTEMAAKYSVLRRAISPEIKRELELERERERGERKHKRETKEWERKMREYSEEEEAKEEELTFEKEIELERERQRYEEQLHALTESYDKRLKKEGLDAKRVAEYAIDTFPENEEQQRRVLDILTTPAVVEALKSYRRPEEAVENALIFSGLTSEEKEKFLSPKVGGGNGLEEKILQHSNRSDPDSSLRQEAEAEASIALELAHKKRAEHYAQEEERIRKKQAGGRGSREIKRELERLKEERARDVKFFEEVKTLGFSPYTIKQLGEHMIRNIRDPDLIPKLQDKLNDIKALSPSQRDAKMRDFLRYQRLVKKIKGRVGRTLPRMKIGEKK